MLQCRKCPWRIRRVTPQHTDTETLGFAVLVSETNENVVCDVWRAPHIQITWTLF